ncbi:hypothetical protein D0X99_10105 [Algoriphagus lacus]|uniref:Nuclear transport factor 2 family protein n=1 Tax=Algoriphagus lacus TaxID=2056311 RepID=A0A418PS51_9BACT|nr:hypothetical protein [Algoriphagus lacus]RIW15767.1 hypothetical protein D0X99_10105 [Algoriphagus lacus]
MSNSAKIPQKNHRVGWLVVFLICLGFNSICLGQTLPAKESLLEADRSFSKMGREKGLKAAFLHFADPEAILLRDGSEPIRGLEAIGKSFGPEVPGFVLAWEPEFARVAESGELGYTLGHFQALDSEGKILNKGSYTSVWRKNSKGEWKWLIDVGVNY